MHDDEAAEQPDTTAVVGALVSNHRQFLAFLERRLHDRALAEDILQDAFARGIDKASTLREDETAIAWFYKLLRNAVIDDSRRRATAHKALERFATELQRESPDEEALRTVCACVAELADTLKPEYASALKRIEVDGVSVKDFAVETGVSGSNAAVRVFRAREALRKQVARSCGTCAEHGCLDCHCKM